MKKIFTTIVTLSLAFGLNTVNAAEQKPVQKKDAASADAPADGEVDISDVQNQYWKAHDKQFEVIQNKLYNKEGRFEITPLFGLYQRVDFQDAKTLGASLAYHLSDSFGFEVQGYKIIPVDSRVVTKFKETRGATPEFNEEKFYAGGSVMWSPIYGKFSFLGKKISHFDMYISAGGGVTKTLSQHFTYHVALGQKFWITPRWNVRLEYRWLRYTDKVTTNEGATAIRNGGPGYFSDPVTDTNLQFGIGFLF